MSNYQCKSPILFIIFNRKDTSLKVLEQIRLSQPERLYILGDGGRADRTGEHERCEETREAVLNAINWNCEVKTLFSEINQGPKEAIATGITWFFEQEEEGIILEHDCLPSNSFFSFCDTLLEKYREDKRIWMISGCNFQKGKQWGDGSYYFSNLTNGWGWATWRRSWSDYDKDLLKYESSEIKVQLEKIFQDPLVVDTWIDLFNLTKSGKINTWDYQVTFTHLFNHAINVVPNKNLVSNIGFGELAENTVDANSVFSNVPLEEITTIIHPKYILPEHEADMSTLTDEFGLIRKRAHLKKHNSLRRRFKRWLRKTVSRS
jgi:hypothetical protein